MYAYRIFANSSEEYATVKILQNFNDIFSSNPVLFIISIIFWLILNIKGNSNGTFFVSKKNNYFFYFLFILIFLQIIVGAFVSGLDAGLIYQTWPLMDFSYFPGDITINKYLDLC